MAKYDGVNKLFIAYMAVTFLSCLLMPNSLGLVTALGWSSEHIPVYSWISNVTGVMPFYPDFFVLSWIVLPFWLILYGVVYTRIYSSMGINMPLLIVAWFFLAALLAFLVFSDIRIGDSGATSRAQIVIWAARSRVLGSFIFSGFMSCMMLLSAAVFVKTPIDIVRNIRIYMRDK